MKRKKTTMFTAVLLLVATVFAGCSENDSPVEVKSVKDVEGNYYGGANVTFAEKSPNCLSVYSEDVADQAPFVAKIENDTIYFKCFPTIDLVCSIVGWQLASSINQCFSPVEYKVPYKAKFSDDFSQILMELTPGTLVLENPNVPTLSSTMFREIIVEMATRSEAVYKYEGNRLEFRLDGTKVTTIPDMSTKYPLMFSFGMSKVNGEIKPDVLE